MKFQEHPNDALVNVTKMVIKTGEIVTCFRHWHIFLLKNQNRGQGAYVSKQYNSRTKKARGVGGLHGS